MSAVVQRCTKRAARLASLVHTAMLQRNNLDATERSVVYRSRYAWHHPSMSVTCRRALNSPIFSSAVRPAARLKLWVYRLQLTVICIQSTDTCVCVSVSVAIGRLTSKREQMTFKAFCTGDL
jgi:hypothetical protein